MNSNRLQSWLLPFLSLGLAFTAGVLAHAWWWHRRPVPPPPLHPFDEFIYEALPHARHPHRDDLTPERIADLNRRLEMLQPQMGAFRQRFQEIEAGYRQAFLGLLTPEQQGRLASFDLISSDLEVFPDRPLRPEGRAPRGFPGEILRIIAFRPHWARLSKELGLTELQRQQFRTLLEARRSRFIALVDETPPPSIELGQSFEPEPGPGSP